MTLIDLDKVRWKEGFYDMHTGEQFAPMMFNTPEWLEWATAEAEVKAIPIEWIEKYAKRFIELENRNYFAYRGFSDIGEAILNMLENWEQENGTI